VTLFTVSSVDWAESTVATRHSSGFVKWSATFASGYASQRRRMISGARSSIGSSRVRCCFAGTPGCYSDVTERLGASFTISVKTSGRL